MITGLYAGILALIYVALSFNVILRRVKSRTLFGDNGDAAITRAVRIHGNFAEYVPFILLALMLYEMQAGSIYMVHALGILLIIARAFHIFGLHRNIVWGRLAGTVLTMLLLVLLGVMLVVKGIRAVSVLQAGPVL